MRQFRLAAVFTSLVLLAGCVTASKQEPEAQASTPPPTTTSSATIESDKSATINIDPRSPIPTQDQILGQMALLVAQTHINRNQPSEAQKSLSEAVANPGIPTYYRAKAAEKLGALQSKENRTEAAAESFEKATDLYGEVTYPGLDVSKERSAAIQAAVTLYTRAERPARSQALLKRYGLHDADKGGEAWVRLDDGSLFHKKSRISFPAEIGAFKRGQERVFNDDHTDFAVSYGAPGAVISVIIYPSLGRATEPVAWQSFKAMSAARNLTGKPRHLTIEKGRLTNPDFAGTLIESDASLKNGVTVSTGVVVLGAGSRHIKIRYTVSKNFEERGLHGLGIVDSITTGVRWQNT